MYILIYMNKDYNSYKDYNIYKDYNSFNYYNNNIILDIDDAPWP